MQGLSNPFPDRRATIQTDESYPDDVMEDQHQPLKIRVRQPPSTMLTNHEARRRPRNLSAAGAIHLTKVQNDLIYDVP
jgi:hypothetical protein